MERFHEMRSLFVRRSLIFFLDPPLNHPQTQPKTLPTTTKMLFISQLIALVTITTTSLLQTIIQTSTSVPITYSVTITTNIVVPITITTSITTQSTTVFPTIAFTPITYSITTTIETSYPTTLNTNYFPPKAGIPIYVLCGIASIVYFVLTFTYCKTWSPSVTLNDMYKISAIVVITFGFVVTIISANLDEDTPRDNIWGAHFNVAVDIVSISGCLAGVAAVFWKYKNQYGWKFLGASVNAIFGLCAALFGMFSSIGSTHDMKGKSVR